MRKETQKLGHDAAAKIQKILADMSPDVPVVEFYERRYEPLKETVTRVEFTFQGGTKLSVQLDEKDAK